MTGNDNYNDDYAEQHDYYHKPTQNGVSRHNYGEYGQEDHSKNKTASVGSEFSNDYDNVSSAPASRRTTTCDQSERSCLSFKREKSDSGHVHVRDDEEGHLIYLVGDVLQARCETLQSKCCLILLAS